MMALANNQQGFNKNNFKEKVNKIRINQNNSNKNVIIGKCK